MIIGSITYEVWDEEALEVGESNNRGFKAKDEKYTFKELIDLLKSSGYIHLSNSKPSVDFPGWISTEPEEEFCTGGQTIFSFHPNKDKRSIRYYLKALKHLGITD